MVTALPRHRYGQIAGIYVVDLFLMACILLVKLWNLAMISYKPRPLHLEKYLAS